MYHLNVTNKKRQKILAAVACGLGVPSGNCICEMENKIFADYPEKMFNDFTFYYEMLVVEMFVL